VVKYKNQFDKLIESFFLKYSQNKNSFDAFKKKMKLLNEKKKSQFLSSYCTDFLFLTLPNYQLGDHDLMH
jgi:hypothetical protein